MGYVGHARKAPRGVLALVFLLFLIGLPHEAHAADLSFSPTSASFPLDQEFSIKVMVDPGGASVNASDGTISFDKDILSVVSVSKDGSAFSLWTADPTFSNSGGTVAYSGGSPTPFSKSSAVLTIRMKGKAVGSGKLSFSKGSILAADGKGTDVYKNGGEAAITITEAAAASEPPVDELPPGPVPLAPEITSSTHAKPDQWYATSTVIFTWKLQPDVIGARILLSDKEDAVPTQVQKGAATTTTYTGVADGVSYFLVQLKNDSGWGETGKKKIQIDTVPPKEFEVALLAAEAGGVAKLSFQAEDDLSGIDRYEILAGDTVLASPRAQDVANGSFPVPPQAGGDTMVIVKAYDKAGNVREAKRQLTLPKVDKPVAKGAEGDAPPPAPTWTLERILLILFALTIGALATRNYQSRNAVQAERAKLLHRVSEIADRNDRVFSAMREEFEQMVQDLDEKPQLTPAEREFLENVKEVIDISEELIYSGVEELKKQIRGQ